MTSISFRLHLLSALLWLVSATSSAWAHNGSFALAVAIEGVVDDGDLRDWPQHLPVLSATRCETPLLTTMT